MICKCIYAVSLTTCTCKPLFHHSYEMYGWTCIYTLSPSNDMQFTNCTTRKLLFHDPYESCRLWTCIYTQSPSNDMQFTNCTTRKLLFHGPYDCHGLVYTLKVPLKICSSPTVRLVNYCFTTRTTHMSCTSRQVVYTL